MAIKISIEAALKGLQNLHKVEKSLEKIKNVGNKGFSQMLQRIRQNNGALAENNKFLSRSADRVGFMAFQFTFLEGIAQRVLGSIQRFFTDIIRDGASGIEGMVRAVAQSGIDFSGQTEDSANAVKLLNDALLDLGGGKTKFNIQEVSEAMKEIGKATNLTGTELEKANKLIGVTQQVLRLMTIEQVDSEESAKTIIKTMNNFGLTLSEAARVTDVMINVNQSSAITLDELSRSFGFASSQAREFGLDVEETGALIGVLGNRLGQGAGAAGRNFRQLLVGLKNNALKSSAALDFMGISILDNNKNIKPFIQFLDEVRGALDKAGQSSDAFKIFLQKQMGLEVRAADALAKLTQATKEEIEQAVAAARAGDSSALEGLLGSTPEANIAKITNALKTLNVLFTTGLSPAIAQVSEEIVKLVRDAGLQEMATELGAVFGQELIPIIRTLSKQVKKLADFFREHEGIMHGVIKVFIAFLGLLVGTLIIASVGKVVAAFTSILLKLSLVLGTGEGVGLIGSLSRFRHAALSTRHTLLTIIAVVAGVIIALFAFRSLFKNLIDGVQEGEEPLLLISGALTAVGLALAFAAGGPIGLGVALAGMAVIAIIEFAKITGATEAFGETFDKVMQKIEDEDLEGLDALLVTFLAFAMGMESAGEVMGQSLGESATNWILDMQDAFDETDWGELWKAFQEGNVEKAIEVMENLAISMVASFIGFLFGVEGLEALTGQKIEEMTPTLVNTAAISGALIGEAFRDAVINAFILNLRDTIIDALVSILPPGISQLVGGALKGFITGSEEAAARRGVQESDANDLGSRFNGPPGINIGDENFQPAPQGEGIGELIPKETLDELNVGMEELKAVWIDRTIQWSDEYLGQATPLTESVAALTTEVDKQTVSATQQITQVDFNTLRTKALSAQEQLTQTEFGSLTLEIARQTNFTIDLQSATQNVGISLSKLAIEGTEAARRLASLTVSDDGEFSISGRQTTTSFGQANNISTLGAIIATAVGEKIDLAALTKAQSAASTVNVGGITINIEGSADSATVDKIAEAVQTALNKEIGNKDTLLASGVI